jgi:hypothetical protein
MRELTDYERGFLRAIEKKGGELVMRGKHAHHKWDYLVEAGYLHRHLAPVEVVVYVLTEKGSAALAKWRASQHWTNNYPIGMTNND